MKTKDRIEKLESTVASLVKWCELLKEGFQNTDEQIMNLLDIRVLDHGTEEEVQAISEKRQATVQAEIDKLEAKNETAWKSMRGLTDKLSALD